MGDSIAETTSAAPTQAPTTPRAHAAAPLKQKSGWGAIFALLGVGTVLLAVGIVLILTGADDTTDAATVFGYFLAGLGGLAAQVAIIALGVRLGVDKLIGY